MNESDWPAGTGESAALVRRFDWAATPLGPIGAWPARLRTLVDVVLRAPVGMALLWGERGTMIYNDEYAKVCADRHPAMLGAPLRDAWPEAWEFNSAMLRECLQGQDLVFRAAHFLLERDGTTQDRWFDLYYAPVVGDDKQVCGVMATVIETTSQMLAEFARARHEQQLKQLNAELDEQRAQLQQANQRLAADTAFLNSLFAQAPSFMAVLLGPDHVYQLANQSYQRLVGHRDILGKPVRIALPELAEQGVIAILDQVYASGEPFYGKNHEVLLDSGRSAAQDRVWLDFLFQPLKDANGVTYGIFIEGIDVTAHAIAEERLRVAQEAGEVGTFEWYPATGVLVVSDTYRRVLGIAPATVVTAELLFGLIDPAHRHQCGAQRLGRQANPLEYAEFRITRADTGEQRWIARKGQAIGAASQQHPRYLGVVFDVTDRKLAEAALRELNESLERKVGKEVAERIKAEEALRQAQKMEAVGQLASGVAHDFNNVLQIVSSNLQLMELDANVSGLLRSRLAHAVAAVERGAKLSSQLLAFARRQPLQPVVTNLGQLLRNIEHLLQRALGDNVRLEIDVEPGLWSTSVDPNQIENAILNMAINARDAMHGTGQLTIRVGNRSAQRGAMDYVSLSIADTGCGMPPEVLDKVFDPFYTTKEPGKGTGLGMSMVYGFVKQSGGEIRIDSSPGMGTTINIDLPRAHDVEAPVSGRPGPAAAGGDETVLVVEDDPAVRSAAIDLLASLGYRALKADNGQQAVAILQSGMPVDLLFTDVFMPGDVDSFELVALAHRISPATAILLTSGHSLDGSLPGRAMPQGIDMLPKPYGREQLALKIRQVLAGRPSPAPSHDNAVPLPAPDKLSVLVVEDDHDARELACEMLAALGHSAQGTGSAEQALQLLEARPFDVLFTDLNLPGISGVELVQRACAAAPGIDVILASGEGRVPLGANGCKLAQLPKPYDLMQLQLNIDRIAQSRKRQDLSA